MQNKVFNKSFLTNLIALFFILIGYMMQQPAGKHIFTMGLFAFSGAITNWLAIYMLFEKVPFLYGSGVIPVHFEEFKKGINELVMTQFFTEDNVAKFFDKEHLEQDIDIAKIILDLDMEKAFHSLVAVIMNSKFGGMLNMFGGTQALEPLKVPFEEKMKETIIELTSEPSFKQNIMEKIGSGKSHKELIDKVSTIVTARLDELTPQMVKEIIQNMIRKHLGWLVVWGGVFGALIGLLSSITGTF